MRSLIVCDPFRSPNEFNNPPTLLSSIEERPYREPFTFQRRVTTDDNQCKTVNYLDYFGEPIYPTAWRTFENKRRRDEYLRDLEAFGEHDTRTDWCDAHLLEFLVDESLLRRVAEHELGHFIVGCRLLNSADGTGFQYVTTLPARYSWCNEHTYEWPLGNCPSDYLHQSRAQGFANASRVAAMVFGGKVAEELLYEGKSYPPSIKRDLDVIEWLKERVAERGGELVDEDAKNEAVSVMQEFRHNHRPLFDELSNQLVRVGTFESTMIQGIGHLVS